MLVQFLYNIIISVDTSLLCRYFSQGAVDIYNSLETDVQDNIFEHNGPVTINKGIPLRGHSGGLSIGF